MLYQQIFTDKLRLQLSTENVNIKMASKARMIKEGGKKKETATVEVNILTIFLFNEAHAKSTIEFFSSSKSILLPQPFTSFATTREVRVLLESSLTVPLQY